MPHATAIITGEQRDAIYDLLVGRLTFLPDLLAAVEQEDFETANRLVREFAEDFRLLADLGWGPDQRSEVPLTIPARSWPRSSSACAPRRKAALGVSRRARSTERPRKRTSAAGVSGWTPVPRCWPGSRAGRPGVSGAGGSADRGKRASKALPTSTTPSSPAG